jgi:hypothetical protein
MKPWHRLLISQLVLVGIALNLCGIVRHDDISTLAIAPLLGQTLWYAALILPFAGNSRVDKIATWVGLGGAWLMVSTGLSRGFDIQSRPAFAAIFLAGPFLILLIAGSTYALLRLRR